MHNLKHTMPWALAGLLLVTACSDDAAPRPDALTSDSAVADSKVALDSAAADLGGTTDSSTLGDSAAPYTHEDITVQQLSQWIKAGKAMTLLDVREPSEWNDGHIASATNLPWNSKVLQAKVGTLPKTKPLVLICRSGARSNATADYLTARAFRPVYDVKGGMLAWTGAGLPVVK